MAPVHVVILLLALGVIVVCFTPAVKEAQAGRPSWPWVLGALFAGPYVLLAWLFVVLRRRHRKDQERAMSSPGTAGPALPPAASPFYLHGGTVGFGEAIGQAFRHGFAYRGRASRSAYWWFVLLQAIVLAALLIFVAVVAEVTGGPARVHGSVVGDTIGVALIIAYLFFLYLTLVSLALLVRRLHDIGRSGWWICIGFVPFAGPLILLIFTTLAGEPAPNRYDQF